MTSYKIQLAHKADLPILGSIEIESARRFIGTGLIDSFLDESFDQEQLSVLIESEQVWVACAPGNELVGFAIASVRGSIAYLEQLDVLPDHGRRGLGSQLIAAVSAWAKSKRFDALVLSTFETIPWNAPFYERLGFRVLPVERWSDEIWQVRAAEEAHGLPVDKRVFMQLSL